MKKSLLIPFLLFLMSFSFVQANSSLMDNFAIYELSEVIHGSRYDYKSGKSFKLRPSYDVLKVESAFDKSEAHCSAVSSEELLFEIKELIINHVNYYEEDMDILSEGFVELSKSLESKSLERCFYANGRSFISSNGNFLYSVNSAL